MITTRARTLRQSQSLCASQTFTDITPLYASFPYKAYGRSNSSDLTSITRARAHTIKERSTLQSSLCLCSICPCPPFSSSLVPLQAFPLPPLKKATAPERGQKVVVNFLEQQVCRYINRRTLMHHRFYSNSSFKGTCMADAARKTSALIW